MDRQTTQSSARRPSAAPDPRKRGQRFWAFVSAYGATHFAQRVELRPRASARRGHITL